MMRSYGLLSANKRLDVAYNRMNRLPDIWAEDVQAEDVQAEVFGGRTSRRNGFGTLGRLPIPKYDHLIVILVISRIISLFQEHQCNFAYAPQCIVYSVDIVSVEKACFTSMMISQNQDIVVTLNFVKPCDRCFGNIL